MLQTWVIIPVALAYIGVLFAIARYGDRRADEGRSIIANPYVYSLSLGVYATAWTFYGSVGRAAGDGVGFLPIYIGPTLMMALWWVVMRKIVRISKTNRITSLADFISSRYGKSALIAGLVTVIAVIGIAALHCAAAQGRVEQLHDPRPISGGGRDRAGEPVPVHADTAFWVAVLLAIFTILFGTRHLDASERHEGLVAAIAFESLVKLVAFVAVGIFVTWGIHNGLADIFVRAGAHPKLATLFAPLGGAAGSYASWAWLTVLSMLAIMFLPRQFQIAVVENVNENHIDKAIWLFPLYMLAMNLLVVPVAFGGVLHFSGAPVDPDTFVLTLPMAEKREALALLVFIGGLSAATGMVIVETIALSTMVLQRPRNAGAAAHAVDAPCGAPEPRPASARNPPWRDRRRRAAGVPLLSPGRRGLRAGRNRPDLVRSRRPVRAGDYRWNLLEGRDTCGGARRSGRRVHGLAVYTAAAVVRKIGWLPLGFCTTGRSA